MPDISDIGIIPGVQRYTPGISPQCQPRGNKNTWGILYLSATVNKQGKIREVMEILRGGGGKGRYLDKVLKDQAT